MKKNGITSSGFEFAVDTDNMNDMIVVDALVDIESGDEVLTMKGIRVLMDRVLGAEQKKILYAHLKENGRVPVDKACTELVEIMGMLKEGKN